MEEKMAKRNFETCVVNKPTNLKLIQNLNIPRSWQVGR